MSKTSYTTSGVAKTPKIQHSTSIKLACFECSTSGGQFYQPIWRVGISCIPGHSGCSTLENSRSIRIKNSRLQIVEAMVEARGFEPLTSGLQSPRSAKLSYAPISYLLQGGWLRGRDLNPRPLGYEPNELPDCSTPRQFFSKNVVGLGRVELPTSRLSGVRSNQLSYRPICFLRRFQPQKRATLFWSAVRFDGEPAQGPCSFGGLLDYCLRSTSVSFNFKRSTIESEIPNL